MDTLVSSLGTMSLSLTTAPHFLCPLTYYLSRLSLTNELLVTLLFQSLFSRLTVVTNDLLTTLTDTDYAYTVLTCVTFYFILVLTSCIRYSLFIIVLGKINGTCHKILKEVQIGEEGNWKLCFQWVQYNYDDASPQKGYRFIWRRPDGSLQEARGQARIRKCK